MSIELILLSAAVIAGATGTWSPCGFSAVETLGPCGHVRGRPLLSIVATITFLLGALLGGVITFGALAAVGRAVGASSELAIGIAAAAALAAAAGEVANVRVVPQIRRQVPESWRWRMPLPAVGAAYGLLLGLGFTTFVLTFGVWALAGIAIAAGDLSLGVAIGLAFGAGRALPVVALAPIADTGAGDRALAAMAERPATYRAFRLANAGVLALAAMTMITTGALATRNPSEPAYDPSAVPGQIAYERPGKRALLVRGGKRLRLPGSNPAIGGRWVALTRQGLIELLRRKNLRRVAAFDARFADAIAIDRRFVVWRSRVKGRDRMHVRSIRVEPEGGGTPPGQTGPEPTVRLGTEAKLASSPRNGQLGRPSVDGNRAAWAQAKLRRNSIVVANLARRRTRRVKGSKMTAIQNASIHRRHIAYVSVRQRRQQLKLWRIGSRGAGRTILSRRRGRAFIWSTDLTGKRVYATVRAGGGLKIRSFRR